MTLGLGKIGTAGSFQKGTAGTVARMQTRGRTAPPWLLCLCVLSAMFSYGCALGQGTDASTMRVTTSSLPNGAIKSGYSSGLTASGGVAPYSWKTVGGTLPPGLEISSSTGMITGMPSTTGRYIFTVEATDSSTKAKTALRGLSITIGADALPLSISSSGLPNGELRVSYTSPVNVSGGTAPYTWSVSSGSLPAGLLLNSSNGTISGTPTTSGAFPFSLSVKDSSTDPQSASQSLAITVETMVQVTTASLPSGTTKAQYSAALGAQGGMVPYSWRVNSGSLPAGLTLSQGGAISGMPTQTGNASFSVAVTDSSSTPQTMTQSLSVNIQTTNSAPAPTPLSISTSGVVNGISSQAYSGSVSATGGTSPYTYSVTGGSLPAGLSLNGSTGAISGSPATSGTFPFTVQVKDSSASQQTASASASVIIVGPLQITTTTLPAMQAQSAVNATINISGGMSPFAFGLASGNLPAGLTLNSSTGQISGTPTNAGEYRFTLQVTDPPSLPQTASQTFAGNVTQANNSTPSPVQITTTTLMAATQGNSYSATVAATGGTTPYNWTVASGSLPAGLSLATNGTISGTPSSSGSFPVGVTVTDSSSTPQTATQSYTLTVQVSNPGTPVSGLSGLATCSGTNAAYSCTQNGQAFPLVQLSPADPIPAVLTPYTDPVFGTTVQRVSPPSGYAGTQTLWAPVYSTKSPFSASMTYLLLYLNDGNYFLMNGSTYAPIHKMFFGNACSGSGPWPGNAGMSLCASGNGDSSAVHWMLTNDDCFYYFSNAKLVKYCVSADTTTLIHDFAVTGSGSIAGSTITYVYTRDYNDFSDDDTKVALEIHGAGGITIGFNTYDLSTDTIMATRTECIAPATCDYQWPAGTTPGSNFGHAEISPSGNYVNMGFVCGVGFGTPCPVNAADSTDADGFYAFGTLVRYRANTTNEVNCNSGHLDTGWDAQGNEVRVTICAGIDSPHLRELSTFRWTDGYEIDYPFDSSFYNGVGGGSCGSGCLNVYHVSMQGTRGAVKGYALMSTFTQGQAANSTNPDISTNAVTGAFGNAEIFLVYLGGETTPGSGMGAGLTYRIAHDQVMRTDYWAESHGTVDYNMNTVIWQSTWRANAGALTSWPMDTGNAYVVRIH
jgi:hypothetical protein